MLKTNTFTNNEGKSTFLKENIKGIIGAILALSVGYAGYVLLQDDVSDLKANEKAAEEKTRRRIANQAELDKKDRTILSLEIDKKILNAQLENCKNSK